MIRDSVAHLFSNEITKALIEQTESGVFPARLWESIENSGFHRVMCREEEGGMGESWETAFPILHGIGYHQAPIPLAETIVASFLLSASSVAIPDGPLTFAQADRATGLQLDSGGGKARITGTFSQVSWARWCSHIVVPLGETNDMALVTLDQSAVGIEPRTDKAGMPLDIVTFDSAEVARVFPWRFGEAGAVLLYLEALCKSIMIVGALDFAFDLSVGYVKDRKQFGKAIGKNQAIQQQIALMAGNLSSAKMAAVVAAQEAIHLGRLASDTSAFTTAVAKLSAGEAVAICAGIAHQVHGAIGFTYEYPLNFATRRAWSWREQAGTDASWANRIGQAAMAAGKDRFWERLTAKTLLV